MSSPDDLTEGEPPAIDPYEVLGLERSASPDEVKSAYRKAALKTHPDKAPQDKKDEAKERFQQIAFAYAVLSDPARRKRYDETGSTSEAVVDSEGFSWSDFYREQFRDAISEDAIKQFAEQYKGSDEERADVLAAYEEFEGDMDGVYESVMLSNVLEDDARFRAIIDEAIKKGEVERFDAYAKETKKSRQARVKAAKKEAQEADELAKELGIYEKLRGGGKKKSAKDAEADLAALIQRNQASRASALDKLAEKYGAVPPKGGKGKKRGAKELEPDISEEQFQAIQADMMKKKTKRK
jgi:DnaJ family protein C protein 9